MSRFKVKVKKDKFSDLPDEFKDAVHGASREEIDHRIAEIAKSTEELLMSQERDVDYQDKKAAFKEAGAIYRDGKKANRLKIQYCLQVLGDKGHA